MDSMAKLRGHTDKTVDPQTNVNMDGDKQAENEEMADASKVAADGNQEMAEELNEEVPQGISQSTAPKKGKKSGKSATQVKQKTMHKKAKLLGAQTQLDEDIKEAIESIKEQLQEEVPAKEVPVKTEPVKEPVVAENTNEVEALKLKIQEKKLKEDTALGKLGKRTHEERVAGAGEEHVDKHPEKMQKTEHI